MISHKHKFIFIHIPRTGGTSIESQFNYDGDSDGKKHWCLNDFKNDLTSNQFNDYFKFSFVRNPWDITISKYFSPYYSKINKLSNKSLLYFLENYFPAHNEAGESFHDYFDPSEMHFIGRFETRKTDLVYISNKIGIKLDSKFSVKSKEMQKKRSNKHYTEYYDDETKQMVREKYAKDIEHFEYEFGV